MAYSFFFLIFVLLVLLVLLVLHVLVLLLVLHVLVLAVGSSLWPSGDTACDWPAIVCRVVIGRSAAVIKLVIWLWDLAEIRFR